MGQGFGARGSQAGKWEARLETWESRPASTLLLSASLSPLASFKRLATGMLEKGRRAKQEGRTDSGGSQVVDLGK